jgi:hypothetical protein
MKELLRRLDDRFTKREQILLGMLIGIFFLGGVVKWIRITRAPSTYVPMPGVPEEVNWDEEPPLAPAEEPD